MTENEMKDNGIITLLDEDGKEMQCEYLDTVEYDGKMYCVVTPVEGTEDYEECVYIFLISDNGDETVDLLPVEDEALLDSIFEKFVENYSEEGCSGDCAGCSGCEEDK